MRIIAGSSILFLLLALVFVCPLSAQQGLSGQSKTRRPSDASILLPVEVMGPDGATVEVPFEIQQDTSGFNELRLKMRIHNLRYQTQASVQVNDGPFLAIRTPDVQLSGFAPSFGGIGGGANTIELSLRLPLDSLVTGRNRIRFRFDQTDGVASGYRVLNFNVYDGADNALIPSQYFVEDLPATWLPPLTAASDIDAGKELWHTASLTVPGRGAILAKCGDCHAKDGRDLKYFNYSSNSIYHRARFHGLSETEAYQIASYIRSLNTPAPAQARPWNPPYQPGPGLDSRPVAEWAAGAGIDAVQSNDQATLDAVMAGGPDTTFNWQANLSMREVPIAFPLPDWNQWLPQVHPIDSAGPAFLTHGYYTNYLKFRNNLKVGDVASLMGQRWTWDEWSVSRQNFYFSPLMPFRNSFTAQQAVDRYSAQLWEGVKLWELHQEFGLEGLSQSYFGPKAEPRAWYTTRIFQASPRLMQVPAPQAGIANGTTIAGDTLGMGWYHLQVLLNHGNGWQHDNNPIDWPYLHAAIKGFSYETKIPMPGLHLLYLIKGMQVMEINGKGVDQGWNLWAGDPTRPVTRDWLIPMWSSMDSARRQRILNGYVTNWFQRIRSFTPRQMITGGWVDAAQTQLHEDNTYGSVLWESIARFRHFGVDQAVINGIADWAKTIWPAGDWNSTKSATCWPLGDGDIQCSVR